MRRVHPSPKTIELFLVNVISHLKRDISDMKLMPFAIKTLGELIGDDLQESEQSTTLHKIKTMVLGLENSYRKDIYGKLYVNQVAQKRNPINNECEFFLHACPFVIVQMCEKKIIVYFSSHIDHFNGH